MKAFSLSLVVPTYNEEKLLENFIRKSMSDLAKVTKDFEIVVVNDGSTDGTLEVARRLANEFGNLKIINLKKNYGVGAATKIGLKSASKEFVVNNSVDAFWDTNDLPLLTKYLAHFDFISGYRTNLKANGLYSKFLTLANYYLIRLLFGLNFKSFQTVQLFPRELLRSIEIHSSGTFMPPELLIKAHRLGKSIKEVPLEYHSRMLGKGKCGSPRNILKTFKEIFRFRFQKL